NVRVPPMTDIILHHYDTSPYAEKVRTGLGLKGLAWASVELPVIMPKPNLTALTGGYRKTPVLQIGADIYCDSQLIMRELERPRTPARGGASTPRTAGPPDWRSESDPWSGGRGLAEAGPSHPMRSAIPEHWWRRCRRCFVACARIAVGRIRPDHLPAHLHCLA